MAFLGQFEYTLDAKNRLTIPAKFRDAFEAGAILAQEYEGCVSIWPGDAWDEYVEHALAGHNPLGPEARQMERLIHSTAFEAKLDGAGRLMLPPQLVKHGALEKEVTVVGVRKKVEVWDRRRWQKLEKKLSATAEAAALRLSGSGDTSS